MPKISQIDEVPCQAEVRILQKITLKTSGKYDENRLLNAKQIQPKTKYKHGVHLFTCSRPRGPGPNTAGRVNNKPNFHQQKILLK